MSTAKGIFPCIWLLNGKAVRGFDNNEIVCEDPAELVRTYAASGADGVILFDRSKTDAEHDAAIDLIRRICEENSIPVIGAGNIRRMEDVKKLIYAGCELAALNLSKESNRLLAREVCERFGKERIAGCYKSSEKLDKEWEKLSPWLAMRILLDGENMELAEAELPAGQKDAGTDIPVIALVADSAKDSLISRLAAPDVTAVSGDSVNALIGKGEDAVKAAREQFSASGIEMEEHKKAAFTWADFKKGPDGLLPVVVQEDATDQVLMVAYMNEEAYNLTVETGKMTYYSRSRKSLWIKGETSGHFQYVRSLFGDCDMDTLLARVVQIGAACHTGSHSCFFNQVTEPRMSARRTSSAGDVLREDYRTIIERKENPKEGSYTNYLFDKGLDKMLKKLGEENTEIIIAAKNPAENEIIYEIADYLYHLEVVMAEKGVDWDDITRELVRRQIKG
jgi:phosphoribosyl-ATP pyrophosphohydrolase/phosphoribosyl-AMP cyclohydrolase